MGDLRLVAVCTRNPASAVRAKSDFPEVDTYTDLGKMLHREDVDLVSVLTPPNTHAAIATQCLRAGKHTLVDKPMAITVAECTEMIEAARRANRALAVFNNRRHDGNIRAIMEVIGDVFHIEFFVGGYGPHRAPDRPDAWRVDKRASGGILYDWGGHVVDWFLTMIPKRVAQVTGFFHKLVWHECSYEDQSRAIIRFDNGAVADVTVSRIAYLGKPQWYILGTKGAIIDTGQGAIEGYTKEIVGPPGGSCRLRTVEGEREVSYKESDWVTYYVDLASHLKRGAPVPVSGEHGRRVIAVLEAADSSARSGHSVDVPYC